MPGNGQHRECGGTRSACSEEMEMGVSGALPNIAILANSGP